jgi:hypothetical protein
MSSTVSALREKIGLYFLELASRLRACSDKLDGKLASHMDREIEISIALTEDLKRRKEKGRQA